MILPQELIEAISAAGREKISGSFRIISSESLSGGCINNVQKLVTSSGIFCMKFNNRNSFPGMFEAEASGLDLLRASGSLKVPEVLFTGEAGNYSFIVLEYISSGMRVSDFMSDFGSSLAEMHLNSEDYYGLDHDNYMGSLPQSNAQNQNWVPFFISERLKKQTDISKKKGMLGSAHQGMFEKLYHKLEHLLPEEPPALLHGDLWSGNFMISSEGKACLIDPAVYYGHREADMAMTMLFGGFDREFYESYNERYPLKHGWKERALIYQLYPLLIHVNLFGKSYLGQVEEILKKFS